MGRSTEVFIFSPSGFPLANFVMLNSGRPIASIFSSRRIFGQRSLIASSAALSKTIASPIFSKTGRILPPALRALFQLENLLFFLCLSCFDEWSRFLVGGTVYVLPHLLFSYFCLPRGVCFYKIISRFLHFLQIIQKLIRASAFPIFSRGLVLPFFRFPNRVPCLFFGVFFFCGNFCGFYFLGIFCFFLYSFSFAFQF